MRPLVANCYLGLGELYAQMEQTDTAQKELSTAIDLFRSMEMISGIRQAESSLAKISGTTPSMSLPS